MAFLKSLPNELLLRKMTEKIYTSRRHCERMRQMNGTSILGRQCLTCSFRPSSIYRPTSFIHIWIVSIILSSHGVLYFYTRNLEGAVIKFMLTLCGITGRDLTESRHFERAQDLAVAP